MGWVDRRRIIIDKIVETIIESNREEKSIDGEAFIDHIAEEENCSRRTAREYYKIAMIRFEKINQGQ